MAMVVHNNMDGIFTLNRLNKNSDALAKSLENVSSGMRINGAEDDASGYAIGKRMEVMIRGLDQDVQNVQTGRSLVKVAEGGVREILENLTQMKEMALNAANDTNSDADRAILNRDYQNRIKTIDDIASSTTYNGKVLLDGTYRELYDPDKYKFSKGFSAYSPGCISRGEKDSLGTRQSYYSSVRAAVQNYPDITVRPVNTADGNAHYTCGASFDGTSTAWSRSIPGNTSTSCRGVKMDFSNMEMDGVMPLSLHHTGFTVFCGGCNQCVSFRFDATRMAEESDTIGTDNSQVVIYTIGIQSVSSMDELAGAIFDGLKNAKNRADGTTRPSTGTKDSPIEYISLDSHHDVGIARIGEDIVMLKSGPTMDIFDNSIVDVREKEPPNPLQVQIGVRPNQFIGVNFNSMKSSSMLLDNLSLTNQKRASSAIGGTDAAISYTLNELTRMGAYRMRMEHTENNLVTASENVTAANSTLIDADMAKEMTAYTKNNVLLQASQAMLAQANQSAGDVIGLLR